MDASYRQSLSLATEELRLDAGEMARDPVEALARLGATMILSRYIEAEVSAHLGAERYERTDARTGSRNEHRLGSTVRVSRRGTSSGRFVRCGKGPRCPARR